jgi:hypothetical protein
VLQLEDDNHNHETSRFGADDSCLFSASSCECYVACNPGSGSLFRLIKNLWGKDTKDSKENTGPFLASTSVGEILYATARAFPAANPFPIGESLMQATLSPQEAADLLFYLMNVMSTVSASTTTVSMNPTLSSINAASMSVTGLENLMRLKSDIETFSSKEKQRRSGKKQYEAEIETLKEKLVL